MLAVNTKYFGTLACDEGSVFDFPEGLPAFEEEKVFVLIEGPQATEGPQAVEGHKGDAWPGAPLVFLQSMARAGLCFVALPVLLVDRSYRVAISPEDLEELGLDARRQPALEGEVMVLALVALRDELSATANLMAPIVLNVKTRRGLQAIRRDSLYSHQHPLANPAANTNAAEEAC
jgi:flagellar assembly factor FliW